MITDEKLLPSKNAKSLHAIQSEVENINRIALSVDCVIFGFDENKLKVLLIRSDLKKYAGKWSLLGDLVFPKEDLDAAAYRFKRCVFGAGAYFWCCKPASCRQGGYRNLLFAYKCAAP